MEDLVKQTQLRESAIKWINSRKRDFGKGLELLQAADYKPHVVKTIEKWGASDARSIRAINMELRNFIRESRKAVKPVETAPVPPQYPDEEKVGNIEKELQKEYPDVIKKTLGEFHSLYQQRSMLHKELKAIGEANDEKSMNERKEKMNSIDACSRRMDILWGIFEKYKADGSLPEESFFAEPFDLVKATAPEQDVPGNVEETLPDNLEELKKLKENLRIKISKGRNRLEFQSEKKGDKPNPMPESPKRAELLKNIEEWEKQKEAVEYRIVELK